MNDKKFMYSFLYSLFDGVTPLSKDCGALCSSACCKGDDKTGMLLFPGEQTSLKVIVSQGERLAVCGGKCKRDERPLSCRIFPFFPVVGKNGEVKAQIDARALAVCPLARNSDCVRFDPLFLRRVKTAGRILMKDPECEAFMKKRAGEIEEIRLAEKLLKRKV